MVAWYTELDTELHQDKQQSNYILTNQWNEFFCGPKCASTRKRTADTYAGRYRAQ